MHTQKSSVAIGPALATEMPAEAKALLVLLYSLSVAVGITDTNVRVKLPSALVTG